MESKKRKFILRPQRLSETGRWYISPETRKKFDNYEKWLERKKKRFGRAKR